MCTAVKLLVDKNFLESKLEFLHSAKDRNMKSLKVVVLSWEERNTDCLIPHQREGTCSEH